jgi:hypothetical protein
MSSQTGYLTRARSPSDVIETAERAPRFVQVFTEGKEQRPDLASASDLTRNTSNAATWLSSLVAD